MHRRAASLVETLVVIAIIAVLFSLLMGGIQVARRSAQKTDAQQTVTQLVIALDTYRNLDRSRSYPVPETDTGLSLRAGGVILLLDRLGLFSSGRSIRDSEFRLLDPWGSFYRYVLTRPAPASIRTDWNWDTDAGHEAAWDPRSGGFGGTTTVGPLPFPYVYSLGPEGTSLDARTWVIGGASW